MDTLATLAFDYPARAEFFRKELEHYLLLAREEKVDPFELRGSFAGAMGIPQFMPSSYRAHGIDFNGDGRRDLWHDPEDAIGSVANYLKMYGWQADRPAVVHLRNPTGQPFVSGNIKPDRPAREYLDQGLMADERIVADWPATLIALENGGATDLWLGFDNFYVITRYNRSTHYAMSVYQLAEEIRLARAPLVQASIRRNGATPAK